MTYAQQPTGTSMSPDPANMLRALIDSGISIATFSRVSGVSYWYANRILNGRRRAGPRTAARLLCGMTRLNIPLPSNRNTVAFACEGEAMHGAD